LPTGGLVQQPSPPDAYKGLIAAISSPSRDAPRQMKAPKRIRTAVFLIMLALGATSCRVKLTKAIRYGKVVQQQFEDTVQIDVQQGLIILQVSIEGKDYRFLFDSGAPLSVSTQLQDAHAFKMLSKGSIVDSDQNRQNVEWAGIDSIKIGKITFQDQTAFIGDFQANPVLECLEIDGIVGSNLMRHCNWTIDQEQNLLILHDHIDQGDLKKDITIPFRHDSQYSIFVKINVGRAAISPILVDYGSTASISLSDQIFSTPKNENIIGETWTELGWKQSGLVGKPVKLHREIEYSDSTSIDSIILPDVRLQTSETTSIGNGLLSRFRVTIDWNNDQLHLLKTGDKTKAASFSGFKLGSTAGGGIVVQSVVVGSGAYHEGVRPGMQVIQLDDLNFEDGSDFCDYINHRPADSISMQLVDSTGQQKEYYFERTLR
jgi:hypothetical protein